MNTKLVTEIKKVWEGRMGFNQRPVFEGYVDGKLVVFAERRWLAVAIVDAIVAGHIEPIGDTVMSFAKWAAKNDRAAYDRMPERI